MNVIHKELTGGVDLIAAATNKFKTSVLSVSLVVPLRAETATANALLGDVLCRGSRRYPDLAALSAATDELYGMSLSPTVRQKGECQCISLTASFLDDRFTLDGAPLLEPAAELIGEVLLHPVTENGVFRADYVAGEGANLADEIRAQVNDKRGWSIHRVTELMCEGEAYALDKYGSAEEAESMTAERLWERYQALLREAKVIFYYGGSAPVERVEAALRHGFAPLITARPIPDLRCQVLAHPSRPQVRVETDRMEVAQGKLALGFRTGGIDIHSPEYPALLVLNAVYGGTASSRLFLHVREKLSLCYFASSLVDKLKGILVVSSGVEFSKFEVAQAEILAQLRDIQSGTLSEEELTVGRQAVISSLRTMLDSHGRMEDFWFTQAVAEATNTPEEWMEQVRAVTKEQVVSAAQNIQLDTIYYLTGKEA